jgi:hypothetical protein
VTYVNSSMSWLGDASLFTSDTPAAGGLRRRIIALVILKVRSAYGAAPGRPPLGREPLGVQPTKNQHDNPGRTHNIRFLIVEDRP